MMMAPKCSWKLVVALSFAALYITAMLLMSSSLVHQIISDQKKRYGNSFDTTQEDLSAPASTFGSTKRTSSDGEHSINKMKEETVVATRLFLPFNAFDKKYVEHEISEQPAAGMQKAEEVDLHMPSGNIDGIRTNKEAENILKHLPSLDEIVQFSLRSLEYSKVVIVCVDSFEGQYRNHDMNSNLGSTQSYLWEYVISLRTSLLQSADYVAYKDRIIITPVTPWGRFTTALNVAIGQANDLGFKFICFQSFEFDASFGSADALYRILKADNHGLVAGAVLPGHSYLYHNSKSDASSNRNSYSNGNGNMRGYESPTSNHLTISGTNSPWNTFALWRLEYISLTGFQLVSDGVEGDVASGGVEEVVAISLLQHINPKLNAYLVNTGAIQWQTNFENDEVRAKYHEEKMKSKEWRPRRQIEKLGVPFGKVIHI